MNNNTREQLIAAAKKLLVQSADAGGITARQLAAEAGVNLAMINYCFKSKDELLKLAVDDILSEEFRRCSSPDADAPVKAGLRGLLLDFSRVMLKFEDITRVSIPYLMLSDAITLPQELLPYISRHYGGRKSDSECRVIAFELVYSLQLIFYRAKDFKTYSGIDISDAKQLEAFIDSQLALYLQEN